ncbi:MAG: MFS transporter [Candidatus Wallbacteria bacterium]|nr:MFS transporter [Candidatus Wallbacteria bacterium]
MLKSTLANFKKLSPSAKLYLSSMSFYNFAFGIFGVIFNLYLLEIGLREGQIGTITSVASFVGAIVSLLFSSYIPHFGYRTSVIMANFVSLFALILILFTGNYYLILILFAIHGLGSTIMNVLQSPLTMEIVAPPMRNYFFSVKGGILILVGTLASFLAGLYPTWLTEQFQLSVIRSQHLTIITALFFVLISTYLFRFIRKRKVTQTVEMEGNVFTHMRNFKNWKTLNKFLLPNILVGFGAGAMVPLFNLYFRQKFQFSLLEISAIFTAAQLSMAFFVFLNPYFTRYFRPTSIVTVSQLLSVPFICMIIYFRNFWLIMLAYAMRMGLMNMAGPVQEHFSMACFEKEERPFLSAAKNFSWNITWCFAAYFAGRCQELKLYDLPLYITIVSYLLSILCYWWAFNGKEERFILEDEASFMQTVPLFPKSKKERLK